MEDKGYKCVFCGDIVEEYLPEYCCDGYMCGCMGQPIEPPMHEECFYKEYLKESK